VTQQQTPIPETDQEAADDPGVFAAQIAEGLPFNRLVGLRCRPTTPGSAEAVLPADERLHNHLGSVHAVAELAPAEAAGGIAAVSGLADLVQQGFMPVAKSLSVRYVRLAHGDLTAEATLPEGIAEAARAAAAAGERIAFTLPVAVRAGGDVVAEVEIDYVFKQFGAG
jgi:acyl-coenzyme A thioesterase PaaI-like protein